MLEVEQQPLLYVAFSRGGDRARSWLARGLQQALRDWLRSLPRLGLLRESLPDAGSGPDDGEQPTRSSAGSVSEFDRLFESGYKALVEELVAVSAALAGPEAERQRGHEFADAELVECLEEVTESLLKQWLAHSRTLRLSVLEKISDDKILAGAGGLHGAIRPRLAHATVFELSATCGRSCTRESTAGWTKLRGGSGSRRGVWLLGDLDGKLTRARP